VIPFEVPFNGATRDLTSVTSTTTFNEFRLKLAKKMETQLSLLLHIGYVASYKPKNPRPIPKLLEDTEAWEKLVDDVEEYIKSSKAKNRGKGVVKPFSITIIDTSGPAPKEAAVKKVLSSFSPFRHGIDVSSCRGARRRQVRLVVRVMRVMGWVS
jgi:hypothetical protein